MKSYCFEFASNFSKVSHGAKLLRIPASCVFNAARLKPSGRVGADVDKQEKRIQNNYKNKIIALMCDMMY